jgi:hypothetical protein
MAAFMCLPGEDPVSPSERVRGYALVKPWAGEGLARLARGIEAGVVGGGAMLVLLACASLLRGRAWWEAPNLLGTTFYGLRALRAGAGMGTLAGTALHFVVTGTIGGLFGLVFGGLKPRRLLVGMGIAAGLAWHYGGDAAFWSRVNPLVPLYLPQPAALLAHAMYGACLGWIGQRREFREDSAQPFVDGVE